MPRQVARHCCDSCSRGNKQGYPGTLLWYITLHSGRFLGRLQCIYGFLEGRLIPCTRGHMDGAS